MEPVGLGRDSPSRYPGLGPAQPWPLALSGTHHTEKACSVPSVVLGTGDTVGE